MSGTYMRDYAHMTPEEIAACIQAASEETERTPRAWRPSPMLVGIAATTASVVTLLAGVLYLGWLIFGQPDTGDPAIDGQAAYWGEIMSHSAYGVIGIFGGILGLVGVGVAAWCAWLARRALATSRQWHEQRAEAERIAARERRQIIEAQRIAAGDAHKLAGAVVDLASLVGDLGADLEKIKGAIETLDAAVEMLAARIDAVSDQLVDALGVRNGLRIVRPQAEQN